MRTHTGTRFKTIKITSMKFKNMDKLDMPFETAIPLLFNYFIRKSLESVKYNFENQMFAITIRHPSFEETSGFHIPFNKASIVSGESIFRALTSIQQSKRDFNFDNSFQVEFVIYSPETKNYSKMKMEGAGSKCKYLDPHLKIPFVIKGHFNDNYCLLRSLVMGKAYADRKFAQAKGHSRSEIAKLNKRIERLHKSKTLITKKAIDLLTLSGLPLNKHSYDIDDLKVIFEKCFHDYGCIVYSRDPLDSIFSMKYSLNHHYQKTITIVYFNNHYDYFKETRKAISKSLCKHCRKPCSNINAHRCRFKCRYCHSFKGCPPGATVTTCSECNVSFSSFECFNQHRKKKRQYAVCDIFKKCLQCRSIYNSKKTPHHSCASFYCPYCQQHVEPDYHNCCWPELSERTKMRAIEKQKQFTIVVFDYETATVETYSNEVFSFSLEHIPILVCFSMFCADCFLDSDSANCDHCAEFQNCSIAYPRSSVNKHFVTDSFLELILHNAKFQNCILVAHNASAYDSLFLLERLLFRQICPKVLKNGCKFRCITVKPLSEGLHNSFCVKDSFLFMPIKLSLLPSTFGIVELSKGFFPHLLSSLENLDKTFDCYPDLAYYDTDNMKQDEKEFFLQWYNSLRHQKFNFRAELLKYCEIDIFILSQCLKLYIKNSINLTSLNPLVHCNGFASFAMLVLKHKYIKKNMLGIVPDTGICHRKGGIQSNIALKYISWLIKNGHNDLVWCRNGGEQVLFDEYSGKSFKADAFCRATNTAWFIDGCR